MKSFSVWVQVMEVSTSITSWMGDWYQNLVIVDQQRLLDVVCSPEIASMCKTLPLWIWKIKIWHSYFLKYRQVIAAGEDGYIWRYDYISDETLAEWAKWKSQNSNNSS
jgi:hypothetical protein